MSRKLLGKAVSRLFSQLQLVGWSASRLLYSLLQKESQKFQNKFTTGKPMLNFPIPWIGPLLQWYNLSVEATVQFLNYFLSSLFHNWLSFFSQVIKPR